MLATQPFQQTRILASDGYPIEWEAVEGKGLVPIYQLDKNIRVEGIWAPQKGCQQAALEATSIFELLVEGPRGNGKTDLLLMDFLQHVGKGWGQEWRGIIFRQTFPQLSDVINKSKKWIRQIFPGAMYNETDHRWTFPSGETLYFRFMAKESDYWAHHGHAFPFIGWEELCNWASDGCYKAMMSCSRSSHPGMPRCYRATANPYGPGHNWVKRRFKLPYHRGRVIYSDDAPPRVAIQGHLEENKVLLYADPDYLKKIHAAARNKSELLAWTEGSWDITAGGMFDDIWDEKIHIVPTPRLSKIPKGWRVDRAFDWGSSKPFATPWFAESNGEPFVEGNHVYGRVRGDVYMIGEWYGWDGRDRNVGLKMSSRDIALGILERQEKWGIDRRVIPGPADSAIYDNSTGACIAEDMEAAGVTWIPVKKGPGSRVNGWEQVRTRLKQAIPPENGLPREMPGFFVCDCCEQTIETFPVCPRDEKKLDDVDTDAEDHIADAIRYRLYEDKKLVQVSDW